MKRTLLLLCAVLAGHAAFAANPKDEQTVRTTYAKLAYVVQSRTVYVEAQKHPDLTTMQLAAKLQANELRFDITEMSSGNLSDIESRPYSDFVAKPDLQEVLRITHNKQTHEENGMVYTSFFAIPRWGVGGEGPEDWDVSVKTAMKLSGNEGKWSRYVTATITVSFQGKSRAYHALWLFSDSDVLVIDTVTGNNIVRSFVSDSAYPSVLTDTRLRSRTPVSDWLNSTQRFDASCKPGKVEVCCDIATLRCGVSAEDLRSTKPAPSAVAALKGGL